MRPLVEQYLGGLRSLKRKKTWKDVGITRPAETIERRVEKGLEPQSRASVVFVGPFDYTTRNRHAIRTMASILQTRLRETLREDLGGTYSVGAGASYSRWPRPEFQVSISFGSAPERNDALVTRTFEEIEKFRAEGPTEQELNDAVEATVRSYETSMEQNGYIATQLQFRYRENEPVDGLFTIVDDYRALTRELVHEAAKRYLTTDRYVKVQLFPEKK